MSSAPAWGLKMYNRLFTKILDSSIWLEPHTTVRVWITLIATMDEDGFCQFASSRNLARRAIITDAECLQAIATLEAPDAESSDPDNEGRRIERVPGGWYVLNAIKYRAVASREQAKASTRERATRFREKQIVQTGFTSVGQVFYARKGFVKTDGLKVAFSHNPQARVAELKKKFPDAHLVATERGDETLMDQRHKEFSALQIEGNWFREEGALAEHLQSIIKPRNNAVITTTEAEAEADTETEAKTDTNTKESALASCIVFPSDVPLKPTTPTGPELVASTLIRKAMPVSPVADLSAIVCAIACAHPKALERSWSARDVPYSVQSAVFDSIESEVGKAGCTPTEAATMILERMKALAIGIPASEWRFLKQPAEFFMSRDYRLDVEAFARHHTAATPQPSFVEVNHAREQDEIRAIRAKRSEKR
jgi:hypothetical protein